MISTPAQTQTQTFTKWSRTEYRRALLAQDPHCVYCGKRVSEKTSVLDHVHPRSRGGSNGKRNAALACRRCDSLKGDLTPDELLQWAHRVKAVAETTT